MVTLGHLLATQGGERMRCLVVVGSWLGVPSPGLAFYLGTWAPVWTQLLGSQDPAQAQETLEEQGHRGL